MVSHKPLLTACIVLLVAVLLAIALHGYKMRRMKAGATPKGKQVNVLRMTNGSTDTMKRLTIECDGRRYVCTELKYGIPVNKQITFTSPANIRFEVIYESGKTEQMKIEDLYIGPNEELQIVFEGNGKLVMR